MELKCDAKVVYKELEKTILFKGKIFEDETFFKYDSIKKKIFDKSKSNKNVKNNIRVTEKDTFVLEIEGYEMPDLKYVWNSDTYNYFYDRIKQNPVEKIKLSIVKVKKYPEWNPPEYGVILKDSLENAWNSTKEEIKKELTEKYLNDGKRIFIQEKKENDPNLRDELFNELHVNIICNNCLTCNFGGARYICCECDNFNLCEYCQENARVSHKLEHTFIRLNNPVILDIQKFNSIFCPNTKLEKHGYEPFDIKVEIVNNGENDLQGCFLSPIRFGKNYLGCLKKTITDECKKGDKVSIDVLLKFEDAEEGQEEITPLDYYEGYFRLMTEEGIPFGDILYIKVMIE